MSYVGGRYCQDFSSLIYKLINHEIPYYSSIKLQRSTFFRLYFIEKDIIRGLMEGSLKEVIGNWLILYSSSSLFLILYFIFW